MARELTEKQKRVLKTLENYWSEHQVPPSISDLAKELGINKATAYEHLLALKKKGYLVHQARAGRTWRLVNNPKTSACKHTQVPIVGRVAAGTPILAAENIEDHIAYDGSFGADELFALRVHGESMIDAHIKDRDIVIARKQANANNQDIVVALIDNEVATVKIFESRGDHIRLIPKNATLSPVDYNASRITILGKVVEIRRKIT